MVQIITSEVANSYAEAHSSPENTVLKELNIFTQENIRGAHMISGHLQGNFLSMISQMCQPKFVLELGTYTGYATIALASGMQDDGKIITIDTDASIQNVRDTFWEKASLKDKIEQHIGKALDVLNDISNYKFDLIFIDADKSNYIYYLDKSLELLAPNGTILVDNTLFHGEVFEETNRSKAANHIHNFNTYITNKVDIFHVLLPIRDGITLIRKKTK
jgi:caffeoyl-CoA O-methyltransferase